MSNPIFQKIVKNVKETFWNPELDTQEENVVFVTEKAFSELKDQVLGLKQAGARIDQHIKALTEENRGVSGKIQEMLDAHKELEEKVETITGLDEKIGALSKAISDLRGKLDTKFQEIEQELSQQAGRIQAFGESLSRIDARVEELASTIEANSSREAGVREELMKRLDTLEEENNRLKERVKEFSDVHGDVEERYQALEARIKDVLDKAQAFLEESAAFDSEFKKIHSSHKKLRDQVSEYSRFIDVVLLDKITERLSSILAEELGVQIEGLGGNHKISVGDGKTMDFEIVGHARKNGSRYLIVGGFVKQLKKKDLTDFLKKIDKVRASHEDRLVPIVVANQVPAQVKKLASKQDIKLYLLGELF